MILNADSVEPVNLGSDELVSINQLVSMLEDIAGITLERQHDLSAPQGVRGRNSDNTLIKQIYDWAPEVTLREGMEKTYAWVYEQVEQSLVKQG